MQEMARQHILYLVMNKKKELFDMNKLKTAFLSLLCIALAATSLTSCLSTDDNGTGYTPPTKEQKQDAMLVTAGTDEGKIYIPNKTAEKPDSADINWNVIDSTATIQNFPISALKAFVTDADTRTLIEKAPVKPIVFYMSLYDVYKPSASASGNYYQFWFLPKYTDFKYSTTFENEGQNHRVMITFGTTYIYGNVGYYSLLAFQNKKVAANVIIRNMEIDGKTYDVQSALGLKGAKK